MEKVTAFLEKHVQWLALGLGVIYVLWVVYAYVLTPPVTVALNDRTLTPGEIDKVIASGPASELKRAMDRTAQPKWTVEPFAQNFANAMNWQNVPYPVMARNKPWVDSLGVDAPGQIIPDMPQQMAKVKRPHACSDPSGRCRTRTTRRSGRRGSAEGHRLGHAVLHDLAEADRRSVQGGGHSRAFVQYNLSSR